MKIKTKTIIIIVGIVLLLQILIPIIFYVSTKKDPTPEPNHITDSPVASNILVNQPLSESKLKGLFNITGTLHFVNSNHFFLHAGIYSVEWEFEPDKIYSNDISKIRDFVNIEVFEYKLSFETYGGSEVIIDSNGNIQQDSKQEMDDIYFNSSYTLDKRPWIVSFGYNQLAKKKLGVMVVKNEYRFEGWSIDDNMNNILEYPTVIIKSEKLYAQYTYHSEGKIDYDSISASAHYDNEIQEQSGSFQKQPYENSIDGEIIVADMIDDRIIERLINFSATNISSIKFNDFIYQTGDFTGCLNLTELFIPPTISYIGDLSYTGIKELFIPNTVFTLGNANNCPNLTKVEYEDGVILMGYPNSPQIQYSGEFQNCEKLTEVILHRLPMIDGVFLANTPIEKIIIPATVQYIGYSAFRNCKLLKEVIFLGDKLLSILPSAFDGCTILSDIILRGDLLATIEQFSFRNCFSLKEINFPASTKIDPLAFYGTNISHIGISDNQIQGIVNTLHEMYIGPISDFENKLIINCYRDPQYDGQNIEGEYIAGSHLIEIYFAEFSTQILDAVVHEFCHYYQFILMYGLEGKTIETIKKVGGLKYDYRMDIPEGTYPDPEMNFFHFSINPAIVFILEIGEPPGFGRVLNNLWNTYDELREYLITSEFFGYEKYGLWAILNENIFNFWKDNYVPLLPDLSNWEEYWNQPLESDARYFASIFSGNEYISS